LTISCRSRIIGRIPVSGRRTSGGGVQVAESARAAQCCEGCAELGDHQLVLVYAPC
jgi:hypothetical protein